VPIAKGEGLIRQACREKIPNLAKAFRALALANRAMGGPFACIDGVGTAVVQSPEVCKAESRAYADAVGASVFAAGTTFDHAPSRHAVPFSFAVVGVDGHRPAISRRQIELDKGWDARK